MENKEAVNLNLGIPEWMRLNNMIVTPDGEINDLSKDREAAKAYFKGYVNAQTQYFHNVKEQIDYMIEYGYWESEFLEQYTLEEIEEIFKIAYDKKFRFKSYMGAFKFYNDYAIKSRETGQILERYEDRLSIIALYHADGDFELAKQLIERLISQDFTPATPILLNSGKKFRGEFVSCFLMSVNDSLNDISRNTEFSMQLSKMGGGVALDLTNLRAKGESIKGIPNVAKGVVGVVKLLDNGFRYADQMG